MQLLSNARELPRPLSESGETQALLKEQTLPHHNPLVGGFDETDCVQTKRYKLRFGAGRVGKLLASCRHRPELVIDCETQQLRTTSQKAKCQTSYRLLEEMEDSIRTTFVRP